MNLRIPLICLTLFSSITWAEQVFDSEQYYCVTQPREDMGYWSRSMLAGKYQIDESSAAIIGTWERASTEVALLTDAGGNTVSYRIHDHVGMVSFQHMNDEDRIFVCYLSSETREKQMTMAEPNIQQRKATDRKIADILDELNSKAVEAQTLGK